MSTLIGIREFWLAFLAVAVGLTSVGCTNNRTASPYTARSDGSRSPREAERLSHAALDHLPDDPAEAEMLLRQALAADLYYGPAHNNLGVLFLEQGRLYEAANEFEWARRLMPGHPDPRLNLALTLERAGRIDEAIDEARTALEVQEGHLPSIQTLARLMVRNGERSSELTHLLDDIALRGSTDWRAWAMRRRVSDNDG